MVPIFLSGPASALDHDTVTITGNVPLVTYNVSVTVIGQSDVIVTWKTNGNTNSTVEYGTTTIYANSSTDGVMAEDHTISLSNLLPGTVYYYRVISGDLAGNRAISTGLIFTTTAVPAVTVVPTANSGGTGAAGGGGRGSGTFTGFGSSQLGNSLGGLLAPPEQVLAGLQGSLFPANNPDITTPAASGSYPIGFPGLIYNIDEQGTLYINIGYATEAGATIMMYYDRVEVYQHHSPGVLLTFWGKNLTIINGNITGPVSRAEFVTDPLNATLTFGNVSGSLHAALPSLYQRFNINLTISQNMSTDTLNQFQDTLSRNGLQLDTVAYTFNVQTGNLTTGPANVTFTIPASWVDAHGGKDAVRITRLSEETGQQELVNTVYEGVDAQGTMIFRGDSPNSTSLFGLVTAEKTTATQKGYLNGGAFMRNLVLIIGVIALLAVIAYFGWRKKRSRT